MTAVAISFESAPLGWPWRQRAVRLVTRLSAFLRFRSYPRQRRLRAQAAMRWLSDYSRHQR